MSDLVYTLTPLVETVGLWRYRGDLRDSARKHHLKTLETLPETEGHWKFYGGLSDSSGNGHTLTENGTLTYGVGYTELGNTSVTTSATNYGTIAAGSASDFDMGTSDFTLEAIFKTTQNAIAPIIGKFEFGPEQGYIISPRNSPDGLLRIELGDGVGSPFSQNTTKEISDGRWHYIAVVVNRTGGPNGTGRVSAYIDGIADFTDSSMPSTAEGDISHATEDLEIGRGFVGDLDEICITKKALTATEVESRYSGSFEFTPSIGNHLSSSTITSGDFTTGYTESGTTAVTTVRATDSATIAHESALDFRMYYDDFTIEAIAKFPNPGDTIGGYTLAGMGNPGPGYQFVIDNKPTGTGGVRVQLGDGVFNQINTATTTLVNDDLYHYIACVVDRKGSAQLNIYIDGVLDASSPVSLAGVISGSLDSNEGFFGTNLDGDLDELCITKRALTAAEIAVRAAGHGDPFVINYSGSADISSNIIATSLSAFDIQLKHVCNHTLEAGQLTLDTCTRCLGTGYYYDIKFNDVGRPSILNIEDKLAQALEKLVRTSENKFHENLVVGIHNRLGELVDDVEGIIKYDLIHAVATLKDNQRGVQNLSSRAQIARLDNVSVSREGQSSLRYLVELTTVSGEQVELSGTVHISGQ